MDCNPLIFKGIISLRDKKRFVPSVSGQFDSIIDELAYCNVSIDEVWEDLLAIADSARSISRKEPGFSADFRLGDDTHREIIATATAFLGHLQVPRMELFVFMVAAAAGLSRYNG